jgi:opacity protein-like surface antigen
MRLFRPAMLAVLMLAATSAAARADATLFLGANTTPTNRPVVGGSFGFGLLVVAFEFEYSSSSEDEKNGAPGLKVGSGNALLQTPVAIAGFQPYATAGLGVFRERLGTSSETNGAVNLGGGVKISLAGPLRLRLDYRVFKLGDARYSPSHRLYAGLNLHF